MIAAFFENLISEGVKCKNIDGFAVDFLLDALLHFFGRISVVGQKQNLAGTGQSGIDQVDAFADDRRSFAASGTGDYQCAVVVVDAGTPLRRSQGIGFATIEEAAPLFEKECLGPTVVGIAVSQSFRTLKFPDKTKKNLNLFVAGLDGIQVGFGKAFEQFFETLNGSNQTFPKRMAEVFFLPQIETNDGRRQSKPTADELQLILQFVSLPLDFLNPILSFVLLELQEYENPEEQKTEKKKGFHGPTICLFGGLETR